MGFRQNKSKKPQKHVSLGLCRKQQGFSILGHCILLITFILCLILIVLLIYWMVNTKLIKQLFNELISYTFWVWHNKTKYKFKCILWICMRIKINYDAGYNDVLDLLEAYSIDEWLECLKSPCQNMSLQKVLPVSSI